LSQAGVAALPSPRVFTIPAGAPFLDTFVAALLGGKLVPGFPERGDPLSLARATLYLPTQRARRLIEAAFLAAHGGNATLLPRLVALGEVDEEEFDLTGGLDLAPAIPPLSRRLMLARLVAGFAGSADLKLDQAAGLATAPAAALVLADELAALMDRMATGRVPWSGLDGLVPDELDRYWQTSIRFLKMVGTEAWPAILAERGKLDPAVRRDLLASAEAKRLASGAGGPVIVAGSTGSIPATRALIAAIARHPLGAVVLPGLDPYLDDDSWRLLDPGEDGDVIPTHPQFSLKQLLAAIGIARDEVKPLSPSLVDGRERLLSRALRPAATTDRWREADPDIDPAHALAGVALVVAAEPQEEALAVAVALREALETPGRTATLVTPDRALARRVAADLTRWNIRVDDSAGVPLADSAAGLLARLIADVAARQLAPVSLVTLLNHPDARFGLGATDLQARRDALELAVLRGPKPKAGTAGLKLALGEVQEQLATLHRRDPRRALTDDDFKLAFDLVARLDGNLAPLLTLASGQQPFAALIAAHRDAVENVARHPGGTGLAGADGEMLVGWFDQLADAAADAAPMSLADYAEAVPALMRGIAVRTAFDERARVRILGPLEARLVPLDLVVVSGLDEGRWPPDTSCDPWLSRPMRRTLGLDLPERRIGLSAHDFAQVFGAPEVVLTRARKAGGAPTVPARFLQRLAAVAGEAWRSVEARGERLLTLARMVDAAPRTAPAPRPMPAPPLELRPKQLSVTEVEDFIRDPYTIYARHVLRLSPLDPLDADVAAPARGTIVHEALAEFLAAYPSELPPDALARLLDFGRAAFARIDGFPDLRAVWWPRFQRVARWLVAEERARREAVPVRSLVELGGRLDLPGTGFRLTGRADRIDLTPTGAVLIDYKTGQPPSSKQVESGLAPQLPLEAAMVSLGGFKEVPAGTAIDGLAYVRVSGGEPPGEWKPVKPKDAAVADLGPTALAGLARLVARFQNPTQGYVAHVRPKFEGRHGDYDHLARVAEWSATGGAGEEGEA
jgi:ATP-dependent helicase/nuclease subunit B